MSRVGACSGQRVAILGPGRLGFTLAVRYAELGAEVHLFGHREGSWQSMAEALGILCTVAPSPCEIPALSGLDLFVFCVPDDALPVCAQEWAQANAALAPPRLVLHSCGAADLDVLQPWQGSLRAAAHPMRVITGLALLGAPASGVESVHELDAAPVSVLGSDEEATELACAQVEAWGAEAIAFESSADRRRYHLACCLAANHLTALLAWAEELAGPALGSSAARRALVSLAASALQRVHEQGPVCALTGPVSRGDAVTIQGHLDALSATEAKRYRALLPELLGLARASGGLSDARARELESQFDLGSSQRGK